MIRQLRKSVASCFSFLPYLAIAAALASTLAACGLADQPDSEFLVSDEPSTSAQPSGSGSTGSAEGAVTAVADGRTHFTFGEWSECFQMGKFNPEGFQWRRANGCVDSQGRRVDFGLCTATDEQEIQTRLCKFLADRP
jgi:hypothetical protein